MRGRAREMGRLLFSSFTRQVSLRTSRELVQRARVRKVAPAEPA